MLDITKLLEEIKASPYEELVITAPHTGVVSFAGVEEGTRVVGATGLWKEVPGTRLATIEREHNQKFILAHEKGVISKVHKELEGTFVEAGTPLVHLRHFLSKDEVMSIILKKALYLFNAPERAKYYFAPDADKKIKASGPKAVTVHDGQELFIMSRMKREASLCYSGPEGVIYAVYFQHNENVDAGAPLIGVCPPDQVGLIEDVVIRVQTEWVEQD
ncbi:biotin attachment protein [Desulfovibrio mangrovi]|uniref:biotin attachment protein n=1 Tax=Desulfovibrio mangrovi TaxID=2976983 RepID=UPI0022454D3A|nr:biotin attachment protein [Desulfovibrio mangrovi]UZP67863.1 biotin attachment protein [Desulfovibrio mangrovi]